MVVHVGDQRNTVASEESDEEVRAHAAQRPGEEVGKGFELLLQEAFSQQRRMAAECESGNLHSHHRAVHHDVVEATFRLDGFTDCCLPFTILDTSLVIAHLPVQDSCEDDLGKCHGYSDFKAFLVSEKNLLLLLKECCKRGKRV